MIARLAFLAFLLAAPPAAAFPPATVQDPLEVAADPLDLREVTFGQRDTQLWLKLRTQGDWSAGKLARDALCLELVDVGRVCVGAAHSKPVLRVGGRTIVATVERPDRRSLSAHFHPRAAGLPHGRVQWRVTSGADHVPDSGFRSETISALAQEPCFGAAARAPGRACVNPALRTSVTPRPSVAVWSNNAPCHWHKTSWRSAVLHPCEFGDRDRSRPAVALLIGDSHADHWRGAVDVVAQDRGWRAVNTTRVGCAFSADAYPNPAPAPANCRSHNDQAIRWLHAHPHVRTVFTSASAGRGLGAAGFLAMWRRVPSTVRRIYVIRDVPRMRVTTGACVTRVERSHRNSAGVCAVPRAAAMVADTVAEAARAAPARVRLIDLTNTFCDRTRCFPVIGGAYVYKDDNHLNTVFSTTLGPILEQKL